MNHKEKIAYVTDYLQERLQQEFHYPLRVSYEEGQFMFQFATGKRDCRARLQDSEQIMAAILEGDEMKKDLMIYQLCQVVNAALLAEGTTALSGKSDYEKVKRDLILRPLSYERAKSMLDSVPHIRIGDIVLMLYAIMAHVGKDYFTAKMRRSQMEDWTLSEEEVLEEALVNTSILYPPRLYGMEDLLRTEGMRRENGKFMGDADWEKRRCDSKGYLLTNTLEINGAIALFYPGVAERIAEKFDSDLYIAFTSIHEAQVHNADVISPLVIQDGVRRTNKHCNREDEFLSDHVYWYKRREKTFHLLTEEEMLGARMQEGKGRILQEEEEAALVKEWEERLEKEEAAPQPEQPELEDSVVLVQIVKSSRPCRTAKSMQEKDKPAEESQEESKTVKNPQEEKEDV